MKNKFFTREICVCAHLTQTRYAQKTCAEMRIIMYTMMQVCRELDMTYQTLKYYCNEGLVPGVKRDGNNRRVFDEKDVKWIKDLTCLKKCGLSIQEMKEYLDLCLQGESTYALTYL